MSTYLQQIPVDLRLKSRNMELVLSSNYKTNGSFLKVEDLRFVIQSISLAAGVYEGSTGAKSGSVNVEWVFISVGDHRHPVVIGLSVAVTVSLFQV